MEVVLLKTSKLCGLEYLPPNLLVILLQGLGRKKISPEKRQHVSRNFNLWACDYVPSCLDGFSNNQISYVYKEAVVVPIFRRFPRHHHEIWNTFKFMPQQSYTDQFSTNPSKRSLMFCNIGISLDILQVCVFWCSTDVRYQICLELFRECRLHVP